MHPNGINHSFNVKIIPSLLWILRLLTRYRSVLPCSSKPINNAPSGSRSFNNNWPSFVSSFAKKKIPSKLLRSFAYRRKKEPNSKIKKKRTKGYTQIKIFLFYSSDNFARLLSRDWYLEIDSFTKKHEKRYNKAFPLLARWPK